MQFQFIIYGCQIIFMGVGLFLGYNIKAENWMGFAFVCQQNEPGHPPGLMRIYAYPPFSAFFITCPLLALAPLFPTKNDRGA